MAVQMPFEKLVVARVALQDAMTQEDRDEQKGPKTFIVQIENIERKNFLGGTIRVGMMSLLTFGDGAAILIQIANGVRTQVATVPIRKWKPKFSLKEERRIMMFIDRKTHSVLANSASSEPLTIYILDISRSTILAAWLAESKKVIAQGKARIQQIQDLRDTLTQHGEVQVKHAAELVRCGEEIDTLKKEAVEQQEVVEQLKTVQKTAAKKAAKKDYAVNEQLDDIHRNIAKLFEEVDSAGAASEAAQVMADGRELIMARETADAEALVRTASLSGEKERQARVLKQRLAQLFASKNPK